MNLDLQFIINADYKKVEIVANATSTGSAKVIIKAPSMNLANERIQEAEMKGYEAILAYKDIFADSRPVTSYDMTNQEVKELTKIAKKEQEDILKRGVQMWLNEMDSFSRLADFEDSEKGQKFIKKIEKAQRFTIKKTEGGLNIDELTYFIDLVRTGDEWRALTGMFDLGYKRGYDKHKAEERKAKCY